VPYSKEFRGQVLAACDKGRSMREVATRFDVSESWVTADQARASRTQQDRPLLEATTHALHGPCSPIRCAS